MKTTVSLFIAMSLDGFIAGVGDNLDFLSSVEIPGEDYGYSEFTNSVDTVTMGRKTYDKVLSFGGEFPHKGKKCYVFSKSRTGFNENVTFFNGEAGVLIKKLIESGSCGIYCDGGAELVQQIINENLFDSYVISIIPVILGGGVKLFGETRMPVQLQLSVAKSYPSGLVQLHYTRSKPNLVES